MRMFCPTCGRELPDEDKDIVSASDNKLICQVQCRPCDKVFTICQENRFMKLKIEGRPTHPENR